MATNTDTLSLVIEALAYPWKGGRAKENLLFAAEAGTLEVIWVLTEGPLAEVVFIAEAFDADAPPCWDACNGISVTHRPGWCRHNPEHADLDCGCDEPDWDEDDLEGIEILEVPEPDEEVVTEDEPF